MSPRDTPPLPSREIDAWSPTSEEVDAYLRSPQNPDVSSPSEAINTPFPPLVRESGVAGSQSYENDPVMGKPTISPGLYDGLGGDDKIRATLPLFKPKPWPVNPSQNSTSEEEDLYQSVGLEYKNQGGKRKKKQSNSNGCVDEEEKARAVKRPRKQSAGDQSPNDREPESRGNSDQSLRALSSNLSKKNSIEGIRSELRSTISYHSEDSISVTSSSLSSSVPFGPTSTRSSSSLDISLSSRSSESQRSEWSQRSQRSEWSQRSQRSATSTSHYQSRAAPSPSQPAEESSPVEEQPQSRSNPPPPQSQSHHQTELDSEALPVVQEAPDEEAMGDSRENETMESQLGN